MKNLFESYFGIKIPPNATTHKIACVWHNDKDPSLALDLTTGDFKCYGCDKSGSIKTLLAEYLVIDEAVVDDFHKHLMNEPQIMEWLRREKGWSADTLIKYKIGWNGGRQTIPVRDSEGHCINLRLYSGSKQPKMVAYSDGYGTPNWFPFPPTDPKIYLMEGESDCILARQLGLPAYTQTGGAGTWNDGFTAALANKEVIVMYDVDSAGRGGATKVINAIKFYTKELKNILIPVSSGKKDFSDWILKDCGTLQQLAEIENAASPYTVARIKVSDEPVTRLEIAQTKANEWVMRPVEVVAMLCAKDANPYLVVNKFRCECPSRGTSDKMCGTCANVTGNGSYEIPWIEFLGLIDVYEEAKDARMLKLCDVNPKCKAVKIEPIEYQTIERTLLAPYLEYNSTKDDGVEQIFDADPRQAFIIGGSLRANCPYIVRCIPVMHPRFQTNTLLAWEAEPVTNDVSALIDTKGCEQFRVDNNI